MILGQMPNSGKFFPVNHVIYSSLCAFFASQSELRHLQPTVSVCVCVLPFDFGSNAQFRQVFPGESCYLQLAVCIFCLPK